MTSKTRTALRALVVVASAGVLAAPGVAPALRVAPGFEDRGPGNVREHRESPVRDRRDGDPMSLGIAARGELATPPGEDLVAPGVSVYEGTVSGPNRVHVITIDPRASTTIDVATATTRLPGLDLTTDIAEREHAIAAVNGDYGLFPSRPGHALIDDGVLKQTSPLGLSRGKGFAVRQDGTASFLGRPALTITADPSSGPSFEIDEWNVDDPRHHSIVGYSGYGGELVVPPGDVCAARLLPVGAATWAAPGQDGVVRSYEVDARRCTSRPMPLGSGPGSGPGSGIVIASGTEGVTAAKISRLQPGDSVSIGWSLGWPGVTDLIGGSPVLVEDSRVVVDASCDTYLCGPQPRTAVGITQDGKIVLAVIDGRWPGESVGMTLAELANFMRDQGATWALNLDGGGSSTMWVKGRGIISRPSDGAERVVSSAILILPGRDRSEPALTDLGDPPTA